MLTPPFLPPAAWPPAATLAGPQRPQDDGTLVAQDLGLADTDDDGLPDCIAPDHDGDGIDD